MENEKREFYFKVNGETVFEFEFGGEKSVVDFFNKSIVQNSYGIFGNWSDLGKFFLNEVELKVATIFRDKKGHFVNPKDIIKTEPKIANH